ncbi:hypothetical protein ACU6U9_02735 [Pseudomonas sp. HK3]
MERRESEWFELNSEKLMSVGNEHGAGIKSYLVPSKVPTAVRVIRTKETFKFEYRYEPDLSDQEELDQFEAKLLLKDMTTWIGSKSKRLYALEIPIARYTEFRDAAYKTVRDDLDQVRHEHPRWGSFSAVSNVFEHYAIKVDQNFHLQEYAY